MEHSITSCMSAAGTLGARSVGLLLFVFMRVNVRTPEKGLYITIVKVGRLRSMFRNISFQLGAKKNSWFFA